MAEDFDKSIGERIHRFRKLRGMRQQDIAKALGISFQQVQKYERGANKISFERLHCLSRLFEVPLTAWLEEESPPHSGMESRQALSLLRAFHAIAREEHRRLLTSLAEALAQQA